MNTIHTKTININLIYRLVYYQIAVSCFDNDLEQSSNTAGAQFQYNRSNNCKNIPQGFCTGINHTFNC